MLLAAQQWTVSAPEGQKSGVFPNLVWMRWVCAGRQQRIGEQEEESPVLRCQLCWCKPDTCTSVTKQIGTGRMRVIYDPQFTEPFYCSPGGDALDMEGSDFMWMNADQG